MQAHLLPFLEQLRAGLSEHAAQIEFCTGATLGDVRASYGELVNLCGVRCLASVRFSNSPHTSIMRSIHSWIHTTHSKLATIMMHSAMWLAASTHR